MTKDQRKPVGPTDIHFPYHNLRGEDGAFAQFDAAGRLVDLYCVRGGRTVGPRLTVDYSARTASLSATSVTLYPSADDGTNPEAEIPLEEFIRQAIGEVYRDGLQVPHCFFCLRTSAEVGKLIAGSKGVSATNASSCASRSSRRRFPDRELAGDSWTSSLRSLIADSRDVVESQRFFYGFPRQLSSA